MNGRAFNRRWVLSLCGVLSMMASAPTASALQTTNSAKLIPVPANDDELQALLQSISAEIDGLKAQAPAPDKEDAPDTEEKPDAPEQQRAESVQKLLVSLQAYLGSLNELQSLRAKLEALSDDQAAARFEEELTEIQQQISETKKRSPLRLRTVTDEELAEAQRRLDAAATDLAARVKQNEERDQWLAEYIPQKDQTSQQLEVDKKRLFDEQAEYDAIAQSAADDLQKTVAADALRQAQIDASSTLLTQQNLELQKRRYETRAVQAKQRLPLLEELKNGLLAQVQKLQKVRARSEIDTVEEFLLQMQVDPETFTPYEREHWPVRLQLLQASKEINELAQQLETKDRFTEENKREVLDDIADEREIWQQFLESIGRRQASQINERYRQIDEIMRDSTLR